MTGPPPRGCRPARPVLDALACTPNRRTTMIRRSLLVVPAALAALLFATPVHAAAKEQVVNLEVTKEGFVPAEVKVKAGQPVKLVVTRKTEVTCATEIVMKDFG